MRVETIRLFPTIRGTILPKTAPSTSTTCLRPPRPGRKVSALAAIPDSGAANFLNGAHYAHRIDREATLFVTIHWAALRSSRTPSDLGRRFKNKVGAWLRQNTSEPASWRQFREMGDGFRGKGDHHHLLVWVPNRDGLQDAFAAEVTRLITLEATTATLGAGVLNIKPVRPGDTLTWLASYGVKESPTARALGIVLPHHRLRATGLPVPGQRISVSQSLDRTARAAAGYVDQPLAFFAPATHAAEPAPDSVVPFIGVAPRQARPDPPTAIAA